MRLNAVQLRKVEEQFGIEAIPEEDAVTSDLKEAFGDHTYFLDADGLNIVEPNVFHESSIGNVVKVASWSSDDQTELLRHEPEVPPIAVDLESDKLDPAT